MSHEYDQPLPSTEEALAELARIDAYELQSHSPEDLVAFLDIKTTLMSGGFERLKTFGELVAHGEAALGALCTNMKEGGLWRIVAVWKITKDIGATIELPDDHQLSFYEVVAHIKAWAILNGYVDQE